MTGSALKVLVTGASGGLGRALVAEARSKGWNVTGLYRTAPRDPNSADRVLLGDVTEVDWGKSIEDHKVVFHLAAFVHRVPTGADERRQMAQVNVDATSRLAIACGRAKVKLVYASSVAVFGPTGGPLVGDDFPTAPATDNGRMKLLAEQSIEAAGALGLDFTVLRFPLLYGPHGRGNIEKMLRAIRSWRYWPVGPKAIQKSCLFFEDAANALVLAVASSLNGRKLIVAPQEPASIGGIHAAAFGAFGRRVPPHVPAGLALGVARAIDMMARSVGIPVILAQQVRTISEPARFDGSTFARLTGFEARVSVVDGIARTARSLYPQMMGRP